MRHRHGPHLPLFAARGDAVVLLGREAGELATSARDYAGDSYGHLSSVVGQALKLVAAKPDAIVIGASGAGSVTAAALDVRHRP